MITKIDPSHEFFGSGMRTPNAVYAIIIRVAARFFVGVTSLLFWFPGDGPSRKLQVLLLPT